MQRIGTRMTSGRICPRPDELIAIEDDTILMVPAYLTELESGSPIQGTVIDMDPNGDHWLDTQFGLLCITQSDLKTGLIEEIA